MNTQHGSKEIYGWALVLFMVGLILIAILLRSGFKKFFYKLKHLNTEDQKVRPFRITHEYMQSLNRKRSYYVYIVSLSVLIAYFAWSEGEVTLNNLAIVLFAPILIAMGRGPYPWLFGILEESEWSILPTNESLEFHKKVKVSEIKGSDISKIRVKLKNNKPLWFDVYYLNQVTRIRHYEGMSELYSHALQISKGNATVEQLR